MQALLTGGAGFIGSHLGKNLLAHGFAVDCVDNFSTGSRANVAEMLLKPKFELHVGNAEDISLMAPLVERADVIFHLAASVGVKNIMTQTVQSIENNLSGTSLLLRLASKYNKRTFIFSTSEVYGKTARFPFHEEDDIVLGPVSKLRWSYAASKLVDDYLALAYFHERQTPITIVRLFNTIGAGQLSHYGMVVPRFFQQARAHQTMTIFGDGTQTRCFTDVRDVVEILIGLIGNEKSHGEMINVGSNEELSIMDLALRIKTITRSRSDFQLIPFEKVYGPQFEDMGRRVPSLAKLKALTNYSPRYSLSDTLCWIDDYDLQGHKKTRAVAPLFSLEKTADGVTTRPS
jgi:UDP-glucose 4-epimerase